MSSDGGDNGSLGSPSSQNQLAKRTDFSLGDLQVRPSIRAVEGPRGVHKGEPRVMQVLLALADAGGKVLSRDDLLEQCWDGRIVGEDAVNRAVAEVRRLIAAAGSSVELETVPRVGYRLSGVNWPSGVGAAGDSSTPPMSLARRELFLGGVAGAGLLAVGAVVLSIHRHRAEADRLIERGRALQASGREDGQARAAALFRAAIDQDPNRAAGWGWLAVVSENSNVAREAAERALSLDPQDPNARTVLAFQRLDLEDWTRWEDELLGVVHDDPHNGPALNHLTFFYQGMGRCEDSLRMNERFLKVEPFNPTGHARRAIKHWIFGNIAEADKGARQALRLWPGNATVWNANMVINAFTERARAGLALLADGAHRPVDLSDVSAEAWRATLNAIESRSSRDIGEAIRVNSSAAPLSPGLAANAIMALSYLGEVDTSYRVAEGLFAGRGPLVQGAHGKMVTDLYSRPTWGRAQFLFIPACENLRADKRFSALCRQTGHLNYWRKRGIWPDPFVRGSLSPTTGHFRTATS